MFMLSYSGSWPQWKCTWTNLRLSVFGCVKTLEWRLYPSPSSVHSSAGGSNVNKSGFRRVCSSFTHRVRHVGGPSRIKDYRWSLYRCLVMVVPSSRVPCSGLVCPQRKTPVVVQVWFLEWSTVLPQSGQGGTSQGGDDVSSRRPGRGRRKRFTLEMTRVV